MRISSEENQQARIERFERLYTEHGDAVLRYARRRTDAGAADDVVAETFLVAWRRFDDVPAAPRTWLLGIARRTLANLRRGDRRRDALVERIGHERSPVTGPDHDDSVTAALSRLSATDREVLMLVYWDELSPREAAAVVGVSGIALRSRLHRARQRLARLVAEDRCAEADPTLVISTGGTR